MALPAKFNQVAGYMAKIEAAYGTAETLAGASDGVYPYLGDGLPEPPSALDYLYDGNIGRDITTLFPTQRSAPNGRGYKADFPVLFKGAGTAYLVGTLPPREVDLMLRAAGFNRTFSSGTHTYTPTPAGNTYASLTFGTYAQGASHIMAGCLADWSFEFNDLGCPKHTFPLTGIGAVPADLALPAITYQYPTIRPAVSAGCAVTIGDWVAPDVKGGSFKLGRNLGSARARITAAGGHLGFVPGEMAPELTLMVEQTALVGSPYHTTSGLDPVRLHEAATALTTVSVRFGTATTLRYTVSLTDAQLSAPPKPSADGAVAMWELTFRGTGSTAVSVLFD